MSLKLAIFYWILYVVYYCVIYVVIKLRNQSSDSKYTLSLTFLTHILFFTILWIINSPYVTGVLLLLMCLLNMVKECSIVTISSSCDNNYNIDCFIMIFEIVTAIAYTAIIGVAILGGT